MTGKVLQGLKEVQVLYTILVAACRVNDHTYGKFSVCTSKTFTKQFSNYAEHRNAYESA